MDIRTYSTAVVSILASEETKKLRAENERLRNELASIEEKFRVALGGYHDSNLLSLAESLRKFNEYHSDRIDDATEERDRLQDELDAERAQNKDMRKAIAKAIGIYVSDDKKTITIWDEDRLCINGGQTTEYYRHDNLAQVRAENERLRNELDAMTAHWRNAESDATTAKDNAAELGKALDMCIAERDGAFAEVDALRAELKAHRDERPRLLSANVRLFHENNRLRAELGQCISENNQLTENAAELGQALDLALAERDAAFAEVDALRAELDAMRQAHSVIAARMEAMGC